MVVESAGEDAEFAYDQFAAIVREGEDSFHVLWMSDNNSEIFFKSIGSIKIDFRVTFAGTSLQQEIRAQTRELNTWAEQIAENFSDMPELWGARLFEFHFNHWLWQYLVRFNIFVNQLMHGDYDACYVIGHRDFVAMCQDYCKQNKMPFIGVVSSASSISPFILFSQFGHWLRNFASEIWGWLLTRNEHSSSVRLENWIYAPYPRNWQKYGDQISQRFTGSFVSSLKSRDKFAYLISITHVSERKLKNRFQIARDHKALLSENPNMPYALLESFGSLGAIFKSYFGFGAKFRWLKRWLRLSREGKISWRGADLGHSLFGPIVSAVFVDIPKNRYLGHCVEKALEAMGAETLLVPIFELVEGRSVVRGGKRAGVKVIGVQHGAIGLAHRWRVVLPQGLMKRYGGDAYQPDIYAVEGKVARDWLVEAGIEADRVKVVGAPRVTVDVPLVELEEQNRTLLVLGEYHRPQVLFDWCVKHILNAGYEVVLRPHPAHYQQAAVWLDEQREGVREQISMSVLGDSLADDLLRHKPVCVLASVTGAMVEVALSGWPVGVILSNWLPDYAPLTAMDGAEVFSSNNPGTVADWIERLMTDENYRAAYSQECQASARMHIAMTGDQAAAALADIF